MKKHSKNIQSAQYSNFPAGYNQDGDQRNINKSNAAQFNINEDYMLEKDIRIQQNTQERHSSQSQQQFHKQYTGKSQGSSTIASQPQFQQLPKEQFQTSYKSLLISSRDSITKRKNPGFKPGTAAGTLNHQRSQGFFTDRYSMNQSNGFQQHTPVIGSSNTRQLSSQNGVKKNYSLKNGYTSQSNRNNDQINYKINGSKNSTSEMNEMRQFQKNSNQNYHGMGLEDYFNNRDDANRVSTAQPISHSPATFHPLSQQQSRKQINMQNFPNNTNSASQHQGSYSANAPPPIVVISPQDNSSHYQNQNGAFASNLPSNQQGSMYQNTIIQQQINDLGQNYNSQEVQNLKNILITLIGKEEEILRVLSSRCDGVKQLAEMVYADMPLPPPQLTYSVTPNNIQGNSPANNFDQQTSSPQATVTQTMGSDAQQQFVNVQNTTNYNVLNGQPVNDLAKIRDALHSLSLSLVSASQNEIILGSKLREVEKLNLDISNLKKQIQNYKEKTGNQQKVIDILQTRVKTFQEENNKMLIQMNIEKKSAQTSCKKVASLEKRVEFILENDINVNLNPNDKLRQTLNELLRENEALKRDLTHKNQDIDRLQGQVKKLNSHIQRVNKKMENMRKNPQLSAQNSQILSQNPPPQVTENKPAAIFQKDDIELLKNFKIPQNLNFRIVSLRSDQSNTITDIIELGASAFSKHILSMENADQKKQLVNLVAQQFISYKDLSDRMNQIINNVYKMTTMYTLKEISVHANNVIPAIFNAERANLWIVDKQCGIFQTYTEVGSGNIITNQKDEGDYVNSTLLIPVFCNSDRQQVKAILEISNSYNELFSFDEEYYAIILSYLLTSIFNNIITQQIYDIDMKYNNMLFTVYEELSLQKTKYSFTQKVRMLVKQLFQIDNSLFYFVENDSLVSYNKGQQKEIFTLEHGLAGIAVSEKKSYIIHDIRCSSYFNPLVDVSSLLPVYALPLINKKAAVEDETSDKVLGLLEIVLKSKLQSKLKKEVIIDPNDGYFGLDEPLTHIFEKFSRLVMNSLLNIKFTS